MRGFVNCTWIPWPFHNPAPTKTLKPPLFATRRYAALEITRVSMNGNSQTSTSNSKSTSKSNIGRRERTPTNLAKERKDIKDANNGKKEMTVPTWMLELGMSQASAKRVTERSPTVLDYDFTKDVKPVIDFFRSSPLSMTEKQVVNAVSFGPQVFSKSIEELGMRTTFLRNVAKMQHSFLRLAISKAPHILWMDLINAEQVIRLILERCPHVTEKELGYILTRIPRVLLMKPAEVKERVDFIRDEFGIVDPYAMTKIVVAAPRSLIYEIETTLTRKLSYLKDQLSLPRETVAKVLSATPNVLDSSIEHHLKPVISTVQAALDLPDEELKNLLNKAPGLFEVKGVADRWKWLKDTVGLTDEEISHVVRAVPAVLTYSVKSNLQRKWDFICRTMGGSKEDIIAAPLQTLAVSLQQRAMPRHAYLVSHGITGLSAADILKPSDPAFCAEIAKCDYADYRNYVDSDRFLLFYTQLI